MRRYKLVDALQCHDQLILENGVPAGVRATQIVPAINGNMVLVQLWGGEDRSYRQGEQVVVEE
jgi:hypothetical protein